MRAIKARTGTAAIPVLLLLLLLVVFRPAIAALVVTAIITTLAVATIITTLAVTTITAVTVAALPTISIMLLGPTAITIGTDAGLTLIELLQNDRGRFAIIARAGGRIDRSATVTITWLPHLGLAAVGEIVLVTRIALTSTAPTTTTTPTATASFTRGTGKRLTVGVQFAAVSTCVFFAIFEFVIIVGFSGGLGRSGAGGEEGYRGWIDDFGLLLSDRFTGRFGG